MHHPQQHRFPQELFQLYHGITDADFDITIDPVIDGDDEWASIPDESRRQDQEWEHAARIPVNGREQMGQPQDFFGFRDIDLLHNWQADLQSYTLAPDLETFITRNKQLDVAEPETGGLASRYAQRRTA